VERTASAWASLMARLGYHRYGAAGSDWGTSISSQLDRDDAEHVAGTHLVPPLAAPDPHAGEPTDRVLDGVTLYWLTGTGTGASSARLYWESIDTVARWMTVPGVDVIDVPTGCSVFPAEAPRPSRRWAERRYPDIRYWAEHPRGGHFPALEAPDLFVNDLRAFFRLVR
jgi:pimeloyl-ACP methyl ester carboxylesterase